MKALKYASVFSFPIVAGIAFSSTGWLTYLPLIFGFGFIPIIEQLFRGNSKNLEAAELEMKKKDPLYDLLLYTTSFVHLGFVFWFFSSVSQENLSTSDMIGRISALGVLFGVTGINVAHELGHRNTKFEKTLSQVLLFSTQYTHFFIEHNQGHHKNVSTYEDPASARRGENLYFFWVRSIFYSYLSAWSIQNKELKRKGKGFISISNKMLLYTILQVMSIVLIFSVYGKWVLIYYIASAVMGIVFLETINYIEHYGLSRKKLSEHRYEITQPRHSWNSDHILGRIILFELTRHSDHHYDPSRKYQILRSHKEAPTLPLGYPASMLLSLFPPLWFWVMNKKIDRLEEAHSNS